MSQTTKNLFFISLTNRRLRPQRRRPHRGATREIPVRTGGILSHPVPQPAHQVRQASSSTTLATDSVLAGHRTALLRSSGGQDPDRNPHPRHAAQRIVLQLALHAPAVTNVRGARPGRCPRPQSFADVHGCAHATSSRCCLFLQEVAMTFDWLPTSPCLLKSVVSCEGSLWTNHTGLCIEDWELTLFFVIKIKCSSFASKR